MLNTKRTGFLFGIRKKKSNRLNKNRLKTVRNNKSKNTIKNKNNVNNPKIKNKNMIYIIITTSINNKAGVKNYKHRENRYIECIKSLLKLIKSIDNLHPIIVENNGDRTTYLNSLDCDIIYTDNNKYELKHKGGNELLDIKDVINKYNIDDNDMIIKLTGRYKIKNLDFIKLVINNYDKKDAFVKYFNVCTKRYHKNKDDCVLGLFAIKCKYLKNFDYKYLRSPEVEFAIYTKENIDKIQSINNLGLECCFADNLRILNV